MDDYLAAYYNLPAIVPPPQPGVAPIPITSAHSVFLPTHVSIGARDEVRTLFVAGLPEDVKPREIYNLFREFPGYETSHIRSSDGAKVIILYLSGFVIWVLMFSGEETENLTLFFLVALRICCVLGSAISCNGDACSQCEYKFLRTCSCK